MIHACFHRWGGGKTGKGTNERSITNHESRRPPMHGYNAKSANDDNDKDNKTRVFDPIEDGIAIGLRKRQVRIGKGRVGTRRSFVSKCSTIYSSFFIDSISRASILYNKSFNREDFGRQLDFFFTHSCPSSIVRILLRRWSSRSIRYTQFLITRSLFGI
jgi:hypothetical protein